MCEKGRGIPPAVLVDMMRPWLVHGAGCGGGRLVRAGAGARALAAVFLLLVLVSTN